MSAEELRYSISNVAGITQAELVLKPGVNVLRGRNAVGKTSAMRAITRAQGGAVDLERRDGTDHGEVQGPGIQLRVGKVVRATGQAELSLADVSPLSRLIDPGLKGTDEAARARIRALIELLGLGVNDAAISRLCDGDADLEEWLQGQNHRDLMAASEALRHEAHARARQRETVQEEAEGRVHAARERRDRELELVGGSKGFLIEERVESARDALVGASRAYERAVAQCEAKEKLEAQQAELRLTIGERPNPEPIRQTILQLDADLHDADEQINRLREALTEAQSRRSGILIEIQGHERQAVELSKAAGRWDAAQEILARQAEGPTREELSRIEQETVQAAQDRLECAQHSEAYHTAEADRAAAISERETAKKQAERLRMLAAALPARLGEILAEAGAPGLTVIDGRLHAIVEGKRFDFERRLSDGQRVQLALEVASQAYAGRVVPLSATYWTSLDPENQARFAAAAREKDLYVLSEQPAEGELRVEHVEPKDAA